MRLMFTSFLVCFVFLLSAQPVQQQKTDSATRLIQQFHNQRDAAGIYAMAGKAFRQQLTENAFKEVFDRIAGGLGDLQQYELESFNNNVAKYKAVYANSVVSLYVSLDADNKLEVFYIANYEPPVRNAGEVIPGSNPLQSALDKQVDSLAKNFMSRNNIVGMTVGVLDAGKKQVYGYGETRKGSGQLPDGNTLFEIGSLSKTFAATLLAWFVNHQQVKLDDPVNKYLPDSIARLEFNGKPVTLASLSNHTSGLPRLPDDLFVGADNQNPYKHYSDQKLFAFLKRFTPVREPGAQYEYSNLAVGLLGVILERVSGKPYEKLLEEIIWKPLKMNHTHITIGKEDSAAFAYGYSATGTFAHSWEFQSLAAAGAIRSGINDLLLYAAAQVNDGQSPLQQAIGVTHRQTFASGQTQVALGWHFTAQDGYLAHNGQTGGYTSAMFCDSKSKRAVVLLVNTSVDPAVVGITLLKWLVKQ